MTAKNKDIIKGMIREQVGRFTPGQNGWSEHVDNCIAAEISPACGNDVFVDEGVIDKLIGRITLSESSTCDWKNYDYMEMLPLKQLEAPETRLHLCAP